MAGPWRGLTYAFMPFIIATWVYYSNHCHCFFRISFTLFFFPCQGTSLIIIFYSSALLILYIYFPQCPICVVSPSIIVLFLVSASYHVVPLQASQAPISHLNSLSYISKALATVSLYASSPAVLRFVPIETTHIFPVPSFSCPVRLAPRAHHVRQRASERASAYVYHCPFRGGWQSKSRAPLSSSTVSVSRHMN